MENNTALEIYKDYLEKNGRSPSTIKLYKMVTSELSNYIGKPFKEMTKEDIGQYLKWKRETKKPTGRYAYKKGLANSSYSMYILVLKIFYRWLYGLKRHHYPEQVADLNPSTLKKQPIEPSEIITKQDIATLLGSCRNFREKALVSCLYESACRVSEFLNWRVGDIVFDSRGAVLHVNGKTGTRRLRLIESVPNLQQWLETHPMKADKKAYVWSQRGNEKLGYVYLGRLLKRIFKKAEIDKPSNPHAFRHSRLTELAKFLSDGKLKVFAGWVGGSRMAGTYVHLSGADLDDDLLKAAGVQTEVEEKVSPLKTQKCSRCQTENPGEGKFCLMCGVALKTEEFVAYEMDELASMKAYIDVLSKKIEKIEKRQ